LKRKGREGKESISGSRKKKLRSRSRAGNTLLREKRKSCWREEGGLTFGSRKTTYFFPGIGSEFPTTGGKRIARKKEGGKCDFAASIGGPTLTVKGGPGAVQVRLGKWVE